MAEILFYHLQNQPLEAVLPTLLQKTLERGWRAVVQATVLDGLTTREAAGLLGIPSGTVKTRMARARAQLRGALA